MTVSSYGRIGRGSAFGHHGEILQGMIRWRGEPRRALVTMPCYRLRTTATFAPDPAAPLAVAGARTKARRAAELALECLDAPDLGGTLALASNIPWGAGMGSSTADVVAAIGAVADALGAALGPAEIARLAVAAEVASDPVMFGTQAVLFAQREGAVLDPLGGPLPPLAVLGFEVGGAVATLDFPLPQYTADEIDAFGELVERLRRAIGAPDPRELGRVATASARLNERFLPKPGFEELLAINADTGGLGVQVAHSGSVIGLLYEAADQRGCARAAHLVRDRLGLSPAGLFTSGRPLELIA